MSAGEFNQIKDTAGGLMKMGRPQAQTQAPMASPMSLLSMPQPGAQNPAALGAQNANAARMAAMQGQQVQPGQSPAVNPTTVQALLKLLGAG